MNWSAGTCIFLKSILNPNIFDEICKLKVAAPRVHMHLPFSANESLFSSICCLINALIFFKRCSATSRFMINCKSIHHRNFLVVFLSVCSVHAARVLSLVGINRSCLRFAWEGSKSAFQPTFVFEGRRGVTYIYADTIHAIQIQQFRHIHLILNVKFINIFLASGMIEYDKIPEKSLLQLLVTFYSAS